MIGSAQEMLGAEPDPAKLKQKRDALAAKAELLRELDAEIVGEIHEDEIGGEIEKIQEQIELAIIELDSAQPSGEVRSRVTSRATWQAPTPADEGGPESPGMHSYPPDHYEHRTVEVTGAHL